MPCWRKNAAGYCFGGIHRSVWLEKIEDVFIETAKVDCRNITPRTTTVCIGAELNNISDSAISDILKVSVMGEGDKEISFKLAAKEKKEIAV